MCVVLTCMTVFVSWTLDCNKENLYKERRLLEDLLLQMTPGGPYVIGDSQS